jgi:hypothetical protein
VRGQTSVAAVALSGRTASSGRTFVGDARGRANDEAERASLENFEQ